MNEAMSISEYYAQLRFEERRDKAIGSSRNCNWKCLQMFILIIYNVWKIVYIFLNQIS